MPCRYVTLAICPPVNGENRAWMAFVPLGGDLGELALVRFGGLDTEGDLGLVSIRKGALSMETRTGQNKLPNCSAETRQESIERL